MIVRVLPVAVVTAILLAGSGCASLGDPAAWADGEVRELESGRPLGGALVFIESPRDAGSAATDRTNEAGHFAVIRSVDRGRRTIALVVEAEGFKRAEFPLPTLRSNTLLVRLARIGSANASRIEQMPAPAEGGDGSHGSSGSR